MKKNYVTPDMNMDPLSSLDIITLSVDPEEGEEPTFSYNDIKNGMWTGENN